MGIWFRTKVIVKLVWAKISGGDAVYVKLRSTGDIKIYIARRPFDPFVENRPLEIRMRGKVPLLHDGTVKDGRGHRYTDSNGMTIGFWMHASKTKRVMHTLSK